MRIHDTVTVCDQKEGEVRICVTIHFIFFKKAFKINKLDFEIFLRLPKFEHLKKKKSIQCILRI